MPQCKTDPTQILSSFNGLRLRVSFFSPHRSNRILFWNVRFFFPPRFFFVIFVSSFYFAFFFFWRFSRAKMEERDADGADYILVGT